LAVASVGGARFLRAGFGFRGYRYVRRRRGWRGGARRAMGLPLTAVAAGVTIWAIRRAVMVTRAAS